MKTNIRGKDLIRLGYPTGPAVGLALEAMQQMDEVTDTERLLQAQDVMRNPDNYRDIPYWDKVSAKLAPLETKTELREHAVPFKIYGQDIIEEGAIHQMYQAAKLPVSVMGAIMPDGHSGYGLPIGGVLATKNAIIPYGVGVDIGCRMALTVYPIRDLEKPKLHEELVRAVSRHSWFGMGVEAGRKFEHEVLENELFKTNPLIESLYDRAAKQLGTSGSGNHFVEFGEVEFLNDDILPQGKYLGLLTHSGSRGLGANIAKHYTDRARKARKLDPSVSNLAWLYMDEDEGKEYWDAMNLAGDYAKACHDIIHTIIAKFIKERPLLKIENHHNFAWKEQYNGEELIVHRKGATPAGDGVLGIIPGSMSTTGYVVRGKGNLESLNSASHGAGRTMSRSAAKKSFIWHDVKEDLNQKHIHLIGGGLDECASAYKDVEKVISYQTDLIDIMAKFTPKIVRMAGADQEPED